MLLYKLYDFFTYFNTNLHKCRLRIFFENQTNKLANHFSARLILKKLN